MMISKVAYALCAVMLGIGFLVGVAAPAHANGGELHQEKRDQFDPGTWNALGCHDPGTADELFDSEDCGSRKLYVKKEVWVDSAGIVPLSEVAFCPGPEGSVRPLRAPCPDPSKMDAMWKNCASGMRVGVDQACTKECPLGNGWNRIVREDESCPAPEPQATQPETCPDGSPRIGWGCPVPVQPESSPQYHGCQGPLGVFIPKHPVPMGTPCPWGQIDTGPM